MERWRLLGGRHEWRDSLIYPPTDQACDAIRIEQGRRNWVRCRAPIGGQIRSNCLHMPDGIANTSASDECLDEALISFQRLALFLEAIISVIDFVEHRRRMID